LSGEGPRHRLAREASGLRHLRWAREVVGTLAAHYEHHPNLDDAARAFVLEESVELRSAVERLSARVKPYRDFLERKRTAMRGMVRVGRFLVAEAKTAEDQAEAKAVRDGLEEAFANFDARERRPLKEDVTRAIDELRDHLEAMDERVERRLGRRFLESLYPELDPTRSFIVDDGDPDDDAVR
jgi:flagellar biosynthesis/type III secretory pathway protein FliH